MEECFRRRARRAGLEESLPVGRPMTDEEIEQARLNGQVHINGKTVAGKIGATVSHTMFLTGGLDDESRC
jgi:hypothetical protein